MTTVFANLKNGKVTLATYRDPEAVNTTLSDLILSFNDYEFEILCECANLSYYLSEELEFQLTILRNKELQFDTTEEIRDFIFGEGDLIEQTLSFLDLEIQDLLDIDSSARDTQNDMVDELTLLYGLD